jgi:glycosyltransferase involved in cell wall biosynthesis
VEIKIVDPFKKDGTAINAKGGTELMLEMLNKHVDQQLLGKFQIICSRVRELENKKRILWLHDLVGDPEVAHLADETSRNRFDQLVFVSNSQFQSYYQGLGVPYEKSVVLRNAIEPISQDITKPNDGTIRLIYHTTPHRGLELLIPVFTHLVQEFPNLHLDVYSSFKIYGWDQKDLPYQKLFDECNAHPNITYHGTVSNAEVRQALQKAHIFAYPSIWLETSCISAIEAMSAGCLVVCSDLGALPETVGDFGYTYRWSEDVQTHVNRFYSTLRSAILNIDKPPTLNLLRNSQARANVVYNWELRAREWANLLSSLL